jgi:3-hydroxymyristoyl/3-hydroxydecanoyl-(acyl carrier protein) dehydratase
VLLEIALQPCGWLASYVGCACESEADLLFRNLDGTGTVRREVGDDVGTLRTHARLTSVSMAGGLVIVAFDVRVRAGDDDVYALQTVFGFFTVESMREQAGLRVTDPDRERLAEPCDRNHALPRTRESLRLAEGSLLLLHRVTGLWPTGGRHGKGRVRAEMDVDAGQWFFRAHFFQDPVQPGSLGLEAMLQALQVLALELDLGVGVAEPYFEAIARDVPHTWKYRGQVTPANRRVTVDLELTERGVDTRGPYLVGAGSLWVDGKRIYTATGLGVRVVSAGKTTPGGSDG